jgi:hypothetical protein
MKVFYFSFTGIFNSLQELAILTRKNDQGCTKSNSVAVNTAFSRFLSTTAQLPL